MMSKCSISSSKEIPLFQTLNGIQQLAETRRFKAWFLDQFGVLHDGRQPYPGAIFTLEKLATSGAKMVILSNSSRRASVTMDKLKNLGFDPSLFLGAITSGELTHQYLQRRNDAWFAALGRSCIHMTWNDRGAISLEGLGLQVVENVDEAEFILAHGTEALGLSSGTSLPMKLEDLEEILQKCAAKNIPMVVANPDFVTVEARALSVMPGSSAPPFSLEKTQYSRHPLSTTDCQNIGSLVDEFGLGLLQFSTLCENDLQSIVQNGDFIQKGFPGTLAAKYEKLGGEVNWMGKPDEKIYKSAMAMAGVDAVDCIAVGDSLHHDIKGANIAGIQSAFITGGIHATELGLDKFGEVAGPSSVQALALEHDARPSYVLPAFTW